MWRAGNWVVTNPLNLYEFVLDDGSQRFELTAIVAAECLLEAEAVLSKKLIGDRSMFRPRPASYWVLAPIARLCFRGMCVREGRYRGRFRPLRRFINKLTWLAPR
jgi:hypothetical protein